MFRPCVHRFFHVKNSIPVKREIIQRYDKLRNDRGAALKYFLFDPEGDNFTYDILNRDELAAFVAATFSVPVADVIGYIAEIDSNKTLSDALKEKLRKRSDRKNFMPYGRRIGWYCAVRVLKPRLIVETGVHDGLGSSVLLAALEKNETEGHGGRLIGIDIAANTSWVIPDYLRQPFTHVVGDSHEALQKFGALTIDLFIHDSAHTFEHEAGEFKIIESRMAPGGVVISDNALSTTALQEWSAANGRRYVFWREVPKDHFYPGAGIGISVHAP